MTSYVPQPPEPAVTTPPAPPADIPAEIVTAGIDAFSGSMIALALFGLAAAAIALNFWVRRKQ